MHCAVAADEETVSIDVMDVSDFDGDDNNDVCAEVVPSPRPPSQPRPQSHAAEHDCSPRQPSTAFRLHATNHQHDRTSAVRSVLSRRFSYVNVIVAMTSVYPSALVRLLSSKCGSNR